MNYKITKYFAFFRNKIIFVVLVILCSIPIMINKYWLNPKLEETNTQKAAIIARKFEELGKLNNNDIIDILVAFAKVNSNGLWIHSIKIEANSIALIIRAYDSKVIEKYIHEVVNKTNLKIENMVTKNIKYKPSNEDTGDSKTPPVPFAVQQYLEHITKEEDSTNGESDDDSNNTDYITKNKIFFSYEAQIRLLPKGH